MKCESIALILCVGCCLFGCGEEKPKISIPNAPLSAQQVIDTRNEDARVTDEESYGTSKIVPPEEAESQPSQFGEGD